MSLLRDNNIILRKLLNSYNFSNTYMRCDLNHCRIGILVDTSYVISYLPVFKVDKDAIVFVEDKDDIYVDLVRELRDLFGYVVIGSHSGDVYTDLLEILDPQTTLKTERQKLLDSIASYFSSQLDGAIDNFLSRMSLFGGELSDRDNILLIANINYKKGTITIPRRSYVSTGWDILKGSKKNSYVINDVVDVLRSGNGSPRELSVVVSINNRIDFKDNTLYLMG